jgi:YHS domain-containing protein
VVLPDGDRDLRWGGFDMGKPSAVLVSVLVGPVALAVAVAASAADKPAPKPQTTCPVTGKSIDPKTSPHVDWQGQRIYFADQAAVQAFRKDPEKVFAKIAAEGVTLENIQTTCPVSGESLADGDMGPPVALSYKGRTILFCCNMCPPKFQKDPATYLAKLPGEQPKSN